MEALLGFRLGIWDYITLVAPEDGRVVNLQVRPGMVAGEVRFGAIGEVYGCSDGEK